MWGVYETLSSLDFAEVWADRWEDKREEIGKVGGVQIREISPIRPRGWGSSTEVWIVISTKDFKQGSNILDKSCS